jgi:hypothetical protein
MGVLTFDGDRCDVMIERTARDEAGIPVLEIAIERALGEHVAPTVSS